MALAGQREYAPNVRLLTSFRKDRSFFPWDLRRSLIHLLLVIHDAVRGVFGEYDEIHTWQAEFHSLDHLGNVVGVCEDLFTCV